MANDDPQSGSTNPHQRARVRESQYREIYSNVSQTSMSPFDITLLFQKMSELDPGKLGITDLMSVTMSPQHFKGFVRSLNETLAAYEQAFGKLTILDQDTKPTLNADQILETIRLEREKLNPKLSIELEKQNTRRARSGQQK
jgi:hypothetical protein